MAPAYIYLIILLSTLIVVAIVAYRTNMLRDTIVNQNDFQEAATALKIANPKPPFSLSRAQLAFWTVIIISSFLYVLFSTHFTVPVIADSNLILLGMALVTTATAKVIDDSQKQNACRSQDSPSRGFLTDILSDKNGVSIHRLQNVLWTFVVGIIYIHFVAAECKLPDDTVLTTQLLTLMGISTGAYVGLKATENSQ